MRLGIIAGALLLSAVMYTDAHALARPEVEFKVFQFPANKIPTIDGDTSDWDIVPDSYAIGTDQIKDTVKNTPMNKKDLDVSVKVGWVKGMDKLYFLYEAYDDYWDFQHPDLHNDIFEVVVDGDLSGGPLIPYFKDENDNMRKNVWDGYLFHGVHAQNYHIFTPAVDKVWTMVWGCNYWISELPWANYAYNYSFKQGESGKLVLEFWITPFDYAPYDGPSRAVVSKLEENKIIGLSWSILDYDNENVKEQQYDSFSNLSQVTNMYGDASDLVAFRLMPLEEKFRKPIEAHWSFEIVDMDSRLVAFHDESYGKITKWLWDFGDGTTSTEQNPLHTYAKPGLNYIVILTVEGPAGKSKLGRVWDVAVK